MDDQRTDQESGASVTETLGVLSSIESPTVIMTTAELDQFIARAESNSVRPISISLVAHGYQADLLVGHTLSFVHLSPSDTRQPYYVTIGESTNEGVEFWLHSQHHTWFEGRHLIPNDLAKTAFCEFFRTGTRSPAVLWEEYTA